MIANAGEIQSVVGIDFAASPSNTWAAFGDIDHSGTVRITKIEHQIADDDIVRIVEEGHAVVGIDVPFGWPDQFVSFVSRYHEQHWGPTVSRARFRFRITDEFVHQQTDKWPLSVSTDKLGIPAHRMASLLPRLERCDVPPMRTDGHATHVIEVYPGATLSALGLQEPGYKRADAGDVRERIVTNLGEYGVEFSRGAADDCRRIDDALDASICALTARFYLEGATWDPPSDPVVEKEGWIFFPKRGRARG